MTDALHGLIGLWPAPGNCRRDNDRGPSHRWEQMNPFRRFVLRIAVNIPLGRFSPHLSGFGLRARYFRDEPR